MQSQAYSFLAIAGLVLFTGVTLVGPFSAMRQQLVTVESLDRPRQQIHVLVLDAGSTGTRMHVFTFTNDTDGQLVFESEQFFHTEPGLSHYADDPQQAAQSIVPLLQEAKKAIPASEWRKTPVMLKATAGLRLLPPQTAGDILKEVHDFLNHSPFIVKNDSVSIMDGTVEGIYAWYTVNYLLGNLGDSTKLVATLDLGGASTQVTFAPNNVDTLLYSPPSHMVKKTLMDRTIYLYTHSYLGFGLMSARQSIILATTENPPDGDDDSEIVEVTSPCFPSNMQHIWYHAGGEYRILGTASSWNRFAECFHQTKLFVEGSTHLTRELNTRSISLLAYYFDRAADAKLIDRLKGGKLKVDDYTKAAKAVCAKNSPEKPFLCLDLCYLASLLHYGFGLDWNKELSVVKKIDGVESSWALGASFDLIS